MIRIGIVGLRRGVSLLRTFSLFPETEITALCDPDPAVLTRVGEEHGVSALYADFDSFMTHELDMVVIASPLPQHAAQAIAALESGRHVFSEVPAVASLEEARALARAARRARGKYMMAENCCYWAFIESWRQTVATGGIGKVFYAEAEYVHDCRKLMRDSDGNPTWRAKMPPIHYCTHSLGPLLKITGDRCVQAVAMSTGCHTAPDLGAADMEVALFHTASGSVFKVLTGFSVAREPGFHYYTLYGTQGCLERARGEDKTLGYFESIPHLHGMATFPLTTHHPQAPAGAAAGGHGTAEYYMVRDYLEAIRADREPPLTIHRSLDMTLPGICAHQSAEEGSAPVAIPDSRDW